MEKQKKKLFIIFESFLGASAITVTSVVIFGCGKAKPREVRVEIPTIEGLTFKNQKAYIGKDYSTQISIDITKTSDLRLPTELKSVKSGNRSITDTEYTYNIADNKETADFKIPGKYIKGDIKIDLELVNPTPPPPTPWYLDTTYLNSLTDADVTKEGGEVQTLKVNGLDHKVRLIGVDEDVDSEGNTIHTTWEFANLISDENGFSLATQWNDTNDKTNANNNYLKSSIRYALNKETDEGGCNHILWAQKGATAWSTDSLYKDKCVLDMIEEDNLGFTNVLKAPSKYINIKDASWSEQTVNDKLFLLSPAEMGRTGHQYEETKTTTYSYYKDAKEVDRIKKQVDGTTSYEPSSAPTITSGSGQVYTGTVYNYAGYNSSTKSGGYSLLRSPVTNTTDTWAISIMGACINLNVSYEYARSVAPAFCI